MTQSSSEKRKKAARQRKRTKKPEKLEFVQDFIPVKSLQHGIIETTDGRYIRILEIEPINFMLRSGEEQFNIISSFASWLKISPMRLQFKSITRKADSDKHVAMIHEELEAEESEECRHLGEGYENEGDPVFYPGTYQGTRVPQGLQEDRRRVHQDCSRFPALHQHHGDPAYHLSGDGAD